MVRWTDAAEVNVRGRPTFLLVYYVYPFRLVSVAVHRCFVFGMFKKTAANVYHFIEWMDGMRR